MNKFENNQLALTKLMLACAVLFVSSISTAQVYFGFDSKYILGLPQHNLQLAEESFKTNIANGIGVDLMLSYHKEQSKFSIPLKLGAKYLAVKGDGFNAHTTRFHGAVGVNFEIFKKFNGEVLVGLENNRDFSEFRSQTTDLFRYQLEFAASYQLSPKFGFAVQYIAAIYPLSDVYLFFNPRRQLAIGFNYFPFK